MVLAEIVRAAGAPADSVQVVPCGNDVAQGLVEDDRFAVFSFTGSAQVGWHLKGRAGKKRVLLELGGNAAAIVHGDAANLEKAADMVTASAFAYAGQVCIKTQRLYVERTLADAFVPGLVARAGKLVPADPKSGASILGPLIDEASAKRVEAWVEEARGNGAKVLCGGKRDGTRYPATILEIDGAGRGMKVVDEEVFGPVLTVHRYDRWSDALAMADDTRYGLQAGIFTDSHARVREAAERLHVGGLVVGATASFRVDSMPYGGVRDSGLGREGLRYAIDEMTEKKLIIYAR
jgi:glyceraldehyde-3-phosphate dehydrogenase (NADP+)